MADIGNLRVLVYNDDGRFFGQGLEVDYGVWGETYSAAVVNYVEGLSRALADPHFRQTVMRPGAIEDWADLYGLGDYLPEIPPLTVRRTDLLPFAGIDFYTMVEKEKG